MLARVRADLHPGVDHLLELLPGDEAPADRVGAGDVERRLHLILLEEGEDLGVLLHPAIIDGDGDRARGQVALAVDRGDDLADGDGLVAQAAQQRQLRVEIRPRDVVARGALLRVILQGGAPHKVIEQDRDDDLVLARVFCELFMGLADGDTQIGVFGQAGVQDGHIGRGCGGW